MNLFTLAITVARCLNVGLGAAFAALLLRASLPVWHRIVAVEKWLAAALFLYSASVTVGCALAWTTSANGRSLINLGFLASLVAAHRYLYFIRRDTQHGA